LGKSNEESVIRNEMVKQAVSSVIGRISAATEAKVK
jgi:outer membrane lipopolysaccharide assembly protein LptE/RlpB